MTNKYRYIFSGVIHPERATISLPLITMRKIVMDAGFVGNAFISISASQLTVTFESDAEISEYATLKNYIADIVRAIVDAYGYLSGCGYDVEIVKLIPPGVNQSYVFGVDIPVLKPSESDISAPFNRLMKVYNDAGASYIQHCFADFREAIRSPKDTALFCYRAIESLRQYFKVEKIISSDGASWKCLRETLGVDRNDIDFVKEFADPLRHGEGKSISDVQRIELLKKTKAIIDSYIDFASKGTKI